MNITNKQFEAIERALKLLPEGEAFNILPKETQEIIISADITLVELRKKKTKDNKRIAKYIAEKRKDNKNYAR